MTETDIPINIELGEHGLYYGTSPAMKGLLVTGDSIEQVMNRVPSAISEMRAAAEISALRSQLEEAKEIIRGFLEDHPEEAEEDARNAIAGAMDLIDASRIDVTHPLVRRARSFLSKENGNG